MKEGLKMDLKERLSGELQRKVSEHPSFTTFDAQYQQKREDPSILDYSIRIYSSFQTSNQTSQTQSSTPCNLNNQINVPFQDGPVNESLQAGKLQDWDPCAMLNNLSFLEQKIHQLQDVVHSIIGWRGQVLDELVAQQQQRITADLTSIIVQLLSTADILLPSVKHTLAAATPSLGQLGQFGGVVFPSGQGLNGGVQPEIAGRRKVSEPPNPIDISRNSGNEQNHINEEDELKDEDDAEEGENLLLGTYEILQLEKEEILAPHTHFCTICGKGFKRDANLRMHMRGHGDEYKTPAALAKPNKESRSESTLIKRYSCPYAGCRRNKDHKKFQPLKTILCIKNHYKRTHCDKSYICSRCNTKRFSVIADLKTHEKHCGKDKWLCSCGTTFSRKEKLFGHIALFQGHTPAIPLDETKGSAGTSVDQGDGNQATNKVRSMNFDFSSYVSNESGVQSSIDVKGSINGPAPAGYLSPLILDTCNFGGCHEFPRPVFNDSAAFLLSGSCNYTQKSGEKLKPQ